MQRKPWSIRNDVNAVKVPPNIREDDAREI